MCRHRESPQTGLRCPTMTGSLSTSSQWRGSWGTCSSCSCWLWPPTAPSSCPASSASATATGGRWKTAGCPEPSPPGCPSRARWTTSWSPSIWTTTQASSAPPSGSASTPFWSVHPPVTYIPQLSWSSMAPPARSSAHTLAPGARRCTSLQGSQTYRPAAPRTQQGTPTSCGPPTCPAPRGPSRLRGSGEPLASGCITWEGYGAARGPEAATATLRC
mmetsp:Transcript_10091/g.28993  ORF Transcript_10091/g.28993 Transcript_10091/m.28993 type:complete len:217 (-) Transcript_10091:210-860(-)